MNTHALFYEPAPQSTLWAGLFCAAAIFVLALASGKTRMMATSIAHTGDGNPDDSVPVEVISIDRPAAVAEEESTIPMLTPDAPFPEEQRDTPKVGSKRSQPMARQAPRPNAGTGLKSAGANIAIYAPRPEYPYAARHQSATGSGVASLTINQSGLVTSVRMVRRYRPEHPRCFDGPGIFALALPARRGTGDQHPDRLHFDRSFSLIRPLKLCGG